MHKLVAIGFMVCVLATCVATTQIKFNLPAVNAMTLASNQTSGGVEKNMTNPRGGNMTFVGNMTGGRSMMMPGGNMTFGASLQNAKMHLTEAIMDLKTGNSRGALMELNLTDQGIKTHEQEMKSMMMELKSVMAHER